MSKVNANAVFIRSCGLQHLIYQEDNSGAALFDSTFRPRAA
jgi:hypothetical protein